MLKKTKNKSSWFEQAKYRVANRKWLNYSSEIAMRILAITKENKDLNQIRLAELMDVSPQYVSKIVQGNENLSLESIAKLSSVLGVELISFPDFKYSIPAQELAPEFVLPVASEMQAQLEYVIKPNKEILAGFSTDTAMAETGGYHFSDILVKGSVEYCIA